MSSKAASSASKKADSGIPLWKKALYRQYASQLKKEDLYLVLYWGRQILGIVLGIVWGLIPLTGFVGLLSFLAINMLGTALYTRFLASPEGDEADVSWELLQQGFPASVGIFLMMWIVVYTMFSAS